MMEDIHGIVPAGAANPIHPSEAIAKNESVSEPLNVSDTVEISAAAQLAAKVQQLPEVRMELVEQVRTEVATGTYETPERLEIAVDRIMEELFPSQ